MVERSFDIFFPDEVIYSKEEQGMVVRNFKKVESGSSGKEKDPADGHVHDDTCRCKETSEMTPRELLRLMINDLAFWKKSKKG